jgi:hypothetical protein
LLSSNEKSCVLNASPLTSPGCPWTDSKVFMVPGATGALGVAADMDAVDGPPAGSKACRAGVPDVFGASVCCKVDIRSSALEAAAPARKNIDIAPLEQTDPTFWSAKPVPAQARPQVLEK